MPYPNRAFIFSATIAFVPHPLHPTIWVRVHPCVLLVDCSVAECGVKAQQLCRNKHGDVVTYTHYWRRRMMKGKPVPAPSVVMLQKGWRG